MHLICARGVTRHVLYSRCRCAENGILIMCCWVDGGDVQVRPHPKAQETELVGILAAENGSTESESPPEDQFLRDVRLNESSKVRSTG